MEVVSTFQPKKYAMYWYSACELLMIYACVCGLGGGEKRGSRVKVVQLISLTMLLMLCSVNIYIN